MRETTLCYIEQDQKYLMLHRTKKEHDPSEGKWIGVGGKLEQGETPLACMLREVFEETGLQLMEYQYRGNIYFYSDLYEDEIMYLYTATKFCGEIIECNEGELAWIEKSKIMDLNLWEGDKLFLDKLLLDTQEEFVMSFYYEGDSLINVVEKNVEKQVRQ